MPYIIGKEEIEAVKTVIQKGNLDRYIDGEKSITSKFEREFAKEINTKYALALSSGTAALVCGLVGMEIERGDEIIIPSYTYIATALAILAVGAVPIIADIDSSLTIDSVDIKRKINSKTKAIIPVHMNGLPCNMSPIIDIARKNRLYILEDVAQACGGSYKGKMLGSFGNAGAFSFNHYKIITCGEGGALVTNNEKLYQRAVIHHHGGYTYERNTSQFTIRTCPGENFRISEISSAILQAQLSKLNLILSKLRNEKRHFCEMLRNLCSDIFSFSPINDEDGDCATYIFIMFKTAKEAQSFICQAIKKNINASSPGTVGHVYIDWLDIINTQIKWGTARKMDPNFLEEMSPNTLSILRRTVGIPTQVNRSIKQLDKMVMNIGKILKDLR